MTLGDEGAPAAGSSDTTTATPDRRPILALAAGLLMPGLGHVYTGDFVRALSYLLAVALAVPAAARLALSTPGRGLCLVLFLGVAAALTFYVTSAKDAFRRARRTAGTPARSWQHPAVYALYAVVALVFVLALLTASVRDGVLEAFVVPSASMKPNILPGDRILADKTVGHPGGTALWRGALAIFVNPNDRTLIFIKRVVALPGDRVEIDGDGDGGDVRVNGMSLAEPTDGAGSTAVAGSRLVHERGDRGTYAVLRSEAAGRTVSGPSTPPIRLVVPNGQVFVLGDNRSSTVDSRRFGTVPLADVKGIARQVFFSSGHGDGVRWNRIGRLLD